MNIIPVVSNVFLAVSVLLLSKVIGGLPNLGPAARTQLKLVQIFSIVAAVLAIALHWIIR